MGVISSLSEASNLQKNTDFIEIMGNKWTSEKKASPQEASKKKPPQAPLYLCSERKRVEILFKLD